MKGRVVEDIGALDTHGFGPRMTTWWGNLAYMTLEGTGFALAGAAYLYLAWVNPHWPLDVGPPNLLWSSLLAGLMLLSLIPNWVLVKVSKAEDLGKTRLFLIILGLIGLVAIGLRVMEFQALNVRWDDNAYGSILWFLLGLHTVHLVTEWGDTLVLTVLMFTKHAKPKRFADAEEDGEYWVFVVGTWLLLYSLLYWGPRVL